MAGIVATAEIDIAAAPDRVWETLTQPAAVKQWMFGTDLETDWQVGSPIVWKGEYEGNSYEDKGEVLEYDAPTRLSVSHFSPTTGQDDVPETTTRSSRCSRLSTRGRTSPSPRTTTVRRRRRSTRPRTGSRRSKASRPTLRRDPRATSDVVAQTSLRRSFSPDRSLPQTSLVVSSRLAASSLSSP